MIADVIGSPQTEQVNKEWTHEIRMFSNVLLIFHSGPSTRVELPQNPGLAYQLPLRGVSELWDKTLSNQVSSDGGC
jgi:hypothetical protein